VPPLYPTTGPRGPLSTLYPRTYPTSIIDVTPYLDLNQTIVLKRGDTLHLLACRYRATVAKLQKLNHLGSGTGLVAGRTFIVPREFLLQKGCR
jgi:hypothetical protein